MGRAGSTYPSAFFRMAETTLVPTAGSRCSSGRTGRLPRGPAPSGACLIKEDPRGPARAPLRSQWHVTGLRDYVTWHARHKTGYSFPSIRIFMPHALVAGDVPARLTPARGFSLPTPLGAEGQRWARLYGLGTHHDPWRASAWVATGAHVGQPCLACQPARSAFAAALASACSRFSRSRWRSSAFAICRWLSSNARRTL